MPSSQHTSPVGFVEKKKGSFLSFFKLYSLLINFFQKTYFFIIKKISIANITTKFSDFPNISVEKYDSC